MTGPLRRRDAAHVRDHAVGPSMTPMVDVVLVILIFFMASTSFLGPEWLLRSALPQPAAGASSGEPDFSLPPARFELSLSIDGAGQTMVRGLGLEAGTVEQAATRLREYAERLGPDRLTVHISPAPAVAYRDVVRLHEACAAAGIESVGLN